ncbi:N-acetylglucosamine-6-phosphate deacetylase [Pseudomonas syringae pv. actinidiae]|nr:N-acetylglucosamine-6-phosphate deacetylase [Pseudomonas syringae pv. actinidiae]
MKPARPGPQGNPGLMPHTVLRIFGAHSNSTEEKAKRAINRPPCKLTKTAATSLPALRHAAEIIDTGKINDSKKARLIHKWKTKKMPGYRAFFFASAAAYKL